MFPLVPKKIVVIEKEKCLGAPSSVYRVSTIEYLNDRTLKTVDAAPSDRTMG